MKLTSIKEPDEKALKELSKDDFDYIVECVKSRCSVSFNVDKRSFKINSAANQDQNLLAVETFKNLLHSNASYKAFLKLNLCQKPVVVINIGLINICIN